MILFEWLVIEICIYLLPEQQKERKMNYVDKYYKLSITAGLSKKFRLASLAMFLDITIYGLCIVKKYHFNQQYFKCRLIKGVNRHYQDRCYDVLSGKSTKCIEFSGKSIEFHRLISGDTLILSWKISCILPADGFHNLFYSNFLSNMPGGQQMTTFWNAPN